MGFGFNLGMLFVVLPLTVIFGLGWFIEQNKNWGRALLVLWSGVFFIVLLSLTVQYFTKTIELKKEDYYGHYIINRKILRGKQANWQYEHYSFEIKNNDSIYLHEIDDSNKLHIIKGEISTVTPYNSARLIIYPNDSAHHFFQSNPTTYRSGKEFHLVFNSSKFSNMYFKKGKRE